MKTNTKIMDDYSNVVQFLTKLLRRLILYNKPDRKLSYNWNVATADAIDRMIRTDRRKPAQIQNVIKWCQSDNKPRGTSRFCWAPNILSGQKLRKQFDRLETDMKNFSKDNQSWDTKALIEEVCGSDDKD